jgi:hypothetical protein
MYMTQVVKEVVFVTPEGDPLEQEAPASVEHTWKPVGIDPNGVLPEVGQAVVLPIASSKPFVPVIMGRPGAKDPVRSGRLDAAINPDTVIDGLTRALETYSGPAFGPASTARVLLADLERGPQGRHDADYETRVREARVIAAHLLRDSQEASDYAVATARLR